MLCDDYDQNSVVVLSYQISVTVHLDRGEFSKRGISGFQWNKRILTF